MISAEGEKANLISVKDQSSKTDGRARSPWWRYRKCSTTSCSAEAAPIPRLERDIQREGEAALKAAFGSDIHLWTADTGGYVPWGKVRAAIARIAANPSRWRQVLATLHPTRVGVVGGADTQGCLRGQWIGVEWKRPGEKQRESQIAFERQIRRAGGVYVVATSPEQAVEGVIAALGLDAERDVMERAFGPKSRLGRLRTRHAARKVSVA